MRAKGFISKLCLLGTSPILFPEYFAFQSGQGKRLDNGVEHESTELCKEDAQPELFMTMRKILSD